jgi:hypothetical protein
VRYRYVDVCGDSSLNDASEWDTSGVTAGTVVITPSDAIPLVATGFQGIVVPAHSVLPVIGQYYKYRIVYGSGGAGAATLKFGQAAALWDDPGSDGAVEGEFQATSAQPLEIENLGAASTFTMTLILIQLRRPKFGGGGSGM